jgi:hypothetical protein
MYLFAHSQMTLEELQEKEKYYYIINELERLGKLSEEPRIRERQIKDGYREYNERLERLTEKPEPPKRQLDAFEEIVLEHEKQMAIKKMQQEAEKSKKRKKFIRALDKFQEMMSDYYEGDD